MRDVSEILTKKYYGKKVAHLDLAEEKNPPLLEIMAVFLVTLSGLGEYKTINVLLYGLPKALMLGIVGAAFLHIFICVNFERLKIMARPFVMYAAFICGLFLWSLFIWTHNFTEFGSITRGASKIIYQSIALFAAASLVYLYGRRSIDIFAIGICSANLLIMLLEMPKFGVGASLQSLADSIFSFGENTAGYARNLEIHELTFLYGLFLVYYIGFAPRRTKKEKIYNLVLIALSVFLLLVGIKRIMFPSMALALLFIFIAKKTRNSGAFAIAGGVCMFIFLFIYLHGVHNGYIIKYMNMLGINSMGREYIWSLAKAYYTFSPSFIGLGFEAVDSIVTHFYEMGLLTHSFPFHNDILKVFVELGFPGMCFWGGMQYVIMPIFWKKRFGGDTALLYTALLMTMTVTYLTDNSAFYFWCTIGLRLIPFAYAVSVAESKKKAADNRLWTPPDKDSMKQYIKDHYDKNDFGGQD